MEEKTQAKNQKQEKEIKKRKMDGIVIGDKINKTIIVAVSRVKIHPKYKKRYKVSRKYKVHDPKDKFKVNDKVSIVACRPLSKDKRWRVIYK